MKLCSGKLDLVPPLTLNLLWVLEQFAFPLGIFVLPLIKRGCWIAPGLSNLPAVPHQPPHTPTLRLKWGK